MLERGYCSDGPFGAEGNTEALHLVDVGRAAKNSSFGSSVDLDYH